MLRDSRLLVLLAAGSLTTMAGGVVAPILPEMVQQLHLDPRLAGNLVSIHCLTIALFSPPLGILADRVGRLRVLVPSLVLYGLFGMAGALMQSFWPLLVMRSLLGAASGGIAAASLGLLGSMYEGQARAKALGYATSTLTITGIIFPLLGGWVGATNWRFAFCLYGLGLPLALIAASILKERIRTKPATGYSNKLNNASRTGVATTRGLGVPSGDEGETLATHALLNGEDPHTTLAQVLGHPYVLQLLLSLGLASVAMYAVVIYAPLYLKATIGAGAILNGIVLASRAVGAAGISAFGARRLSQTLGLSKATAVGFGLMALTLGIIPLLRQLNWIMLSAVLFGVGFGIVLPNLYSALANLAPPKLRSSVLAAGIGAGFLGQFLSPILLGPVLGHSGLEGVFYAAACISVVAGVLLLLLSRSREFVNPPEA